METQDPADMTPEERAHARARERAQILAAAKAAGARGPFRWHDPARRYVDAGGRFVSDATVRAAFDTAVEESAARVKAAARQLRQGEITLAEWQRLMTREIKNVHLSAGAMSRGGFSQLAGEDLAFLRERIRSELGYLQARAEAIQSGGQALDGTLIRRAEMYSKAARKTMHEMQRLQLQAIGYNQERNVLGVAEHCSECLELASRGWVPVGSIPAVGERLCLNLCACGAEYRRTRETDPDDFPSIKGTPQAGVAEILRPRVRR